MSKPILNTWSYLFQTEDDAWGLIATLQDLIVCDGQCTVADFKSAMGSGIGYNDTIWGWTDLSNVKVEKGQYGYHIELPEMEYLEV